MEKLIRKMLASENFDLNPDRDKNLKIFIIAKAKKELNGVNGYLSDETVLGWARHFYSESQEEIDRELKEMGVSKNQVTKINKPIEKVKKNTTTPANLGFIQGSIFDVLQE
jgi:hypothetical protein